MLRRLRRQSDIPCVIVASYGRSGSTLLYEALAKALEHKYRYRIKVNPTRFVRKLDQRFVRPCKVLKTHDFAPIPGQISGAKVVFCFGGAADAALSVHSKAVRNGQDWVDKHLINLGATGPFADILDRDIMRLGEQLRGWTTCTHLDVLCVKYDALWAAEDKIAEFTGLPLSLPARKQRFAATMPNDLRARAVSAYRNIDRAVDALPPVFMASKAVEALTDNL